MNAAAASQGKHASPSRSALIIARQLAGHAGQNADHAWWLRRAAGRTRQDHPDSPADGHQGAAALPIGADEVKLLEHTVAYATFPNQGKAVKPHAILEVRSGSGDTIWRFDRDESKKPV